LEIVNVSRKIEFPDPDDLIRRYISGESINKLAREQGVSQGAIARFMRRAGVFQDRSVNRLPLDTETIVSRYLSGESEKAIADSLGVTRPPIRRRLLAAGIQPRGRSEAELLKWSQMSPMDRTLQVAAAHEATRGRTLSHDEKLRQAKGKERTQAHAVVAEFHLISLLAERGISATCQRAIGIYNIDVTIDHPPIAVEIFGGHWHAAGDHKRRFFKRTEQLLNSGWSVVIIWVDGRRYPVSAGCANYIVALAQELGRNIPTWSQYRVILGDGQDAPTSDSYFNSRAIVERFRGGRQPAGDHHLVSG